MSAYSSSSFPQFDPSKMDPKVLMELSQLIQQLPPEQLARMQTLMHNMMAGLDVQKEMEEFEKSLPPGFREKIVGLMGGQMGPFGGGPASSAEPIEVQPISSTEKDPAEMNLHQARLTILRAVSSGKISAEEAEKLLFSA